MSRFLHPYPDPPGGLNGMEPTLWLLLAQADGRMCMYVYVVASAVKLICNHR